MNSRSGSDGHDSFTKSLLANGIASSSSPNISHHYNNGQMKQKSNVRVASAKYHDIAATILRGSRDVEEVFLNTAKNGDLNKLEQLLSQSGSIGLDIDCKDKRTGNTALIWAAKRGHVKAVEALLKHGAEVTLCNHEAQTALETAHSSVRTILLDWVETQTQINERLLLQAAWQGNLSVVRKILTNEKRHPDVNCQSAEGLTPLMLVTRDVQLFERLSAQLNRYYSPVQVAEELIKAKADVSATDSDGRSCLHYISTSKAACAEKLVSVLISGGMAMEVKDKNFFTPIHLASQLGITNNVVALAEGGSDVNVKGFAGSTPLHLTAYNDHQKTASTLLSFGADATLEDDRGLTPMDVAKSKKMKMLLKEAWTEGATKGHHSQLTSDEQNKEMNKKNSMVQKRKPEVIFDDLARNAQNSPVMKPGSAKTRVLSNVEKCKQAEKKILQEVEALKAAHPVFTRETTRILGTSRSKILPQIGRSTSPVLALPAPSPDQVHDLTLEETRQQLLSRGRSISDIKLGYRQSAMSGSVSSDDFVGQFHRGSPLGNDYTQHRRSESEPFSPSFKNLTESCDSILSNTPASLKMKSVTCTSPTSNKSFFMTDKKSNPDDDVFSVTEPHVDFMRCRTIFKEDFILEESRPKDLMSGSDPASSLSSLSTPSPRDAFANQHFFPKSYKLETLVEQQASNQFLSSPLEIWNNPDLRATRPQIRNPRQKVRHRSDNSLSSSLESENESDKKSKRLTPNIFKKSFSDTSSSSDSVNVHKSQSLESLSPRAHSQPAQKKIVSLSDESINTSSKKSQLAASKRKDIPKLNLSQNNTVIPEIKKFQKQQDIVKPFSGKAKMLISADIDNWDSKSIKLYSVSTKKEKNVSSNLMAESPERNAVTVFDSSKNLLENSDSSTTHKINENSKQPLHNSLTVPDFSSRVTNSFVESYNDNNEVERSYFVVTKEAELISNTLYNKTKKKQEAKVSSVKINEPPVTPSARKKSADLAANIERTIMRNHKNNPPLTYRNMTDMLKDQAKPGTEVKKSESPVKSNLNSQKPQCGNVKSSKIKQSSPAKSNSSIPQSNGKKNNSGKTTSPDKEGQKDKPKENTQILAQNTKAAERDNNSQLGHSDPPHIEVDPPSSQTMHKRIETPITTPLIVDPFEAFPQAHIKLIENSTDAVVKLKKSSTSKSHKKSASSKRPVSGSSRQSSAGKKRPNKGKDQKADNDSRPKSSKRNGKHKQTKVNEELDELYDLAESENAVLVSGIGWQLSTSFIKPPQRGSPEQSLQKDLDSSNNHLLQSTLAESKNYLQAFKEKISENSPRFLEMKQQPSPTESKLPTVEDDGYPPMNLDMTQNYGHKILMENFGDPFYAESLSPGEENALGKLSPITELSLSQTVDNILEDFTAARNDQSKDEQIHVHADARQPQKDSSIEHGDQPKQHCSEEDNLDEVIEEILSSTTSSLSSTLRSISSHIKPKPFSGSHTLTYGDHKLLGQMSSLLRDSPFHAQRLSSTINISASEKINKGSNPSNVCSSGENLATSKSNQTIDNQENIQLDPKQFETPKIPNITETVGNAIPLSSKPPLSLKKSIDDETASYVTPLRRSSSTKFQRRRDQNLNEEEAKQLAKVINSFKQMELTTGSGRQDSRNTSIKSPIRKSGSHLAVNEASSNSRPSSMNASFKMKGKFIELKESQVENRKPEAETKNLTGLSNTDDENNPHNEQLSNVKVKIVTEATDDVNTLNKQNRNEIRRESLTGCETMSDTIKGVDDTIQWKKGNILGRGAFGTVWCGLTNEGQLIAVKQIELTTIDTSKAHHEYEKVQEEVELLKTLEHTNIVGYLGTSLEDNIVSIFMQFIPGGSLASILARFGALEESVFRRYTKQILEGVKYLHDNDVIHRDLKGANVMLMPNGVIKLIDFGCAKRMCINLSISQVEILKSMKGTPFWMAPEVVNETGHGKKSDIWSIGCTVFEMATRNPPWSDMNPMAAIFAIGSATRPVPTLDEKFSPEARNFVLQCMTRDQEIRPDAASLLQHPFITKKFIRKE
ncbi:probable serine/threonine-protein kinase DDB_G0282963 isoform X1 [Biomphalaria glabrata]|uniref:Mitogen-activated protein kinase kinase kinase 19 n=1 Tax=Biomphalaria glabrata TaxID=6526 RepID=A0A9W3BKL5_BIOGL|nr:probable serine/threonine-protein kinase DDB_G0282963 isoform X1 [Biomphalaria glabrata]XP_055899973.1 probable serine/threonine-protein kinase DDB_G0282963 isoform X1 [Biomphalaria glabrata]XP_055899974.1 probable serine/threonine-protein kinase DDB_G0282963 isoform X1 [Biomphalaria glabrata]